LLYLLVSVALLLLLLLFFNALGHCNDRSKITPSYKPRGAGISSPNFSWLENGRCVNERIAVISKHVDGYRKLLASGELQSAEIIQCLWELVNEYELHNQRLVKPAPTPLRVDPSNRARTHGVGVPTTIPTDSDSLDARGAGE
jgi:hypothetical protein